MRYLQQLRGQEMTEYVCGKPFQFVQGSRRPKLVFVGEAWGESEERHLTPFVGQTGREFFRMLGEAFSEPELVRLADIETHEFVSGRAAWLEREQVMLTNVLAFRPFNNALVNVCCSKEGLPNGDAMPPLRSQAPRYLRPDYYPELLRLKEEIHSVRPNLVVALGGTALWALCGSHAIGTLRGAVRTADALAPSQKVLPTYHPAGVLYNWPIRGTVVADLMKAKQEMVRPEIVRPQRQIIINPSILMLTEVVPQILNSAKILAVDIETLKGQIRCIGFAWARDCALVIPFIRELKGGNYWGTEEEELQAWAFVRRILESEVPKLFQNGLFDLQYLTRAGIYVRNVSHDTMLLHHVLYPEMPKGLGFLGSIYTNEQAWKPLGRHREELKKDE